MGKVSSLDIVKSLVEQVLKDSDILTDHADPDGGGDHSDLAVTCPNCTGHGQVKGVICTECRGGGKVTRFRVNK